MAHKLNTPEQARAELSRKGISVTEWARRHGLSRGTVHQVLRGEKPCRFGASHKAAVLLGMKEGEITE